MLLSDNELARLQSVAPFLRNEAHAALELEANYEVTMELESHLQPGLRIRAPDSSRTTAASDAPPYALDLFVGLPLNELRALSHADDATREAEIARFGARFSPRLLRAIARMAPHEIDLDAGVQSEAGTLSVMLEED
ncbi:MULTISPECIES: hypothetical protein [unclassified Caballeronia]|uniref:hypothetical protein n=1 Tax=unclassified Caballeronia TaxID=2646786 RepID=UPI002028E9D3|nr:MULTISPECIES: hypothetical protein [unclassified Caballeronia]MDR5796196.1 hypothetical protein [Caballeronia sp. LZ008]